MSLRGESPRQREFVQELKFLLPALQAEALAEWARARMAPDPHGLGSAGDSYRVSSVYFDTAAFDVLARRGSFARSKYRVRRYNGGDVVFLERKTKGAQRVCKRRSCGSLEMLTRLSEPQRADVWVGSWFQRRLLWRALQPVCRIDYERMARISASDYGPVRLTLDRELRVWPARTPSFDSLGEGALLPRQSLILELKFGQSLPTLFRQLISEFALQPQGVSKYRLACAQLGYTASTQPPELAGEPLSEKLNA